MSLTERELAWAAGLFEGEGTIRINKATRSNLGHLVACVVNTDRQILEFFAARWGGRVNRHSLAGPNAKPAWYWTVGAGRAAAFIRDILPFLLTDRVRQKASVGVRFQDGKSRDPGVNRTIEYAEAQWCDYMWMAELNARGVRNCPDVAQFTHRGAR